MKREYNQIRNLIDSAKNVLIHFNIDYNSTAGPLTQELIVLSNQIYPLINMDYPEIASILKNAAQKLVNRNTISQYPYGPAVVKNFINAYMFGDIRTTIKILDVLYPPLTQNTFKIFISHSSEDDVIIKGFIEKILMLGCGFKRTDIFCTLDHTVIRTGDDFRNEIVENMKNCDFIICFISDNYRKSDICQNELGAAWTFNDKRVLPFKFPNVDFNEIGFLNVVKQAADITDKSKLDELYDELCHYYELKQDWKNYNKQKDNFVELANKKQGKVVEDNCYSKTNDSNIIGDMSVMKLSERQRKIVGLISDNPSITVTQMSVMLSAIKPTIERELAVLKNQGIIAREGNARTGHWKITNNYK